MSVKPVAWVRHGKERADTIGQSQYGGKDLFVATADATEHDLETATAAPELVEALQRMVDIYDKEETAPRKGIIHGISVGAEACDKARSLLARITPK